MATTSKKEAQFVDRYYKKQDDAKDKMKWNADYIPFAIGEKKRMQHHSYRPALKEIIHGAVLFTGQWMGYHCSLPQWIVNSAGVLNGCLFYKLFRQILVFPNVAIALHSTLYDNNLFHLYLKYMMTKFNMEREGKVFTLNIQNMEEQIAKYYKEKNCVVVVCEHRSFSVCVIRNGKRIIGNENLIKRFLAFDDGKPERKCFPDSESYYHYRDDYNLNFFIANAADFDFKESVKDKTKNLRSRSDSVQEKDAIEQTGGHEHAFFRIFNNAMDDIEENTNTAPIAVSESEEEEYGATYYHKLKTVDLGKINLLANDVFVGPDERTDIKVKQEKKASDYYEKISAPFAETMCYSADDLMSALNGVLDECAEQNVFGSNNEKKEEETDVMKVIMVGPLTKYYGNFVEESIKDLDELFGIKIEFIKEQVQNGPNMNIGGRSSALQHMVQSVVTAHELPNFKPIDQIKTEIFSQSLK